MIDLLQNLPMETPKEKDIRAKVIECLGYLIESVGETPEAFKANVVQITELLGKLLVQSLSEDDPQGLAIKETLCQIAFFLKEDFQRFLPDFLTILLKDAKSEIDLSMEAADTATKEKGRHGLVYKVKGMGEQRISLNTFAL